MPKFMMVYKGAATDLSEMTEEQAGQVAAAWGAWIQRIGPALSDVGTPLGESSSVVDDGSSGSATSLSGYSIIEASDMSGARALADGHPFLSEGKGDFAVDIYEMLPTPEM